MLKQHDLRFVLFPVNFLEGVLQATTKKKSSALMQFYFPGSIHLWQKEIALQGKDGNQHPPCVNGQQAL